jgi:hypothetical protein
MPFSPEDIALTTRQVMYEGWPILLVSHDADDWAWQFVNGHGDTEATESMVVAVARVAALDETVLELADLPLGWQAWRGSRDEPWQRASRRA